MGVLSNLCLLLSLFNLGGSSLIKLSDCSSNALFNLTNATFDPSSAVGNSTLHLSMFVPKQVDNATATYVMSYGYIALPSMNEIVCARVDCPILPGILSTSITYPIPSYLAGSFKVKIMWQDLNRTELMCVSLSITPGTVGKEVALYSKYIFPPLMCPYYSNRSYIRAAKNA